MKNSLLVVLLLSMPLAAIAQADKEDAVKAECSAILAKNFDGGLDPRIPPDCDSTASYFGIGRDKDAAAARSCALIERIQHVDKDGSMFTGAGILSMVYANGDGGPRDVEAAKRFVCENKEADPVEIDTRLKLIDRIAADPQHTRRFDLCDTASSGLSQGWCASIQLRIGDTRRYNDLVKIVDPLTPAQQELFKTLQAAEGAFETARVADELDLTGTARGAVSIAEENKLRAQFVGDMKLFGKPGFTQPVGSTVVEAKINQDLIDLRAKGDRIFRNTTITFNGIQETQAAWLKYRDAWQKFEASVNPGVSSDSVITQIGRERIYQLNKLEATF
jgi:hypothetical protein